MLRSYVSTQMYTSLLLANAPDCIQTRGDKLLEDVEPEVRHRKTESVELSRAALQISMSIAAHTARRCLLDKRALSVEEDGVIVPLDDISQAVVLERGLCSGREIDRIPSDRGRRAQGRRPCEKNEAERDESGEGPGGGTAPEHACGDATPGGVRDTGELCAGAFIGRRGGR